MFGVHGAQWSLLYGASLGVVHALGLLQRGDDMLRFPVIQQRRVFRVKKEAPLAFGPAVSEALAAAALALSARAALPGDWGSLWRPLVPALLGGVLCAFCWAVGSRILNIVFTERLRFASPGDADPNAALLKALQDSKAAALQDLGALAAGGKAEAWRRRAIFDDDTGAAWQAPVRVCLDEVTAVVEAVAGVLPQRAPASSGASTAPAAAPRWNAAPVAARGLGSASRAHDAAAWALRARCWRGTTAMRALGALAAAARAEDRYGVAQLGSPGLGEAAGALASAALALQAYAKVAPPPRSGARACTAETGLGAVVAASGAALLAAALGAVHALAAVYGADLVPLISACPAAPPYGSAAECAALAARCLAVKE
ncbi:hypothetical protein WJX81_000562 [Elliptochloris bilobata]|uniref:Uncharacterized protein n=1 Tax=Elliptochloris bilobata TaxID=381761 RepID=A0AAW1RP92_9CHLO